MSLLSRLVPSLGALSLLVLALLLPGCAPAAETAAPALDTAALREALRAEIENYDKGEDFPGITVAFELADGRREAFGYGSADLDAGTPMPADGRMLAGSTGKTFLVGTLLTLIDEGRLGLDDTLAQHLGDEEWYPRLAGGDAITLRMLLQHTSGLSRHVFDERFKQMLHGMIGTDRSVGPGEVLELILDREPVAAPGERWAYTDSGYVLLGLVVEKVTGNSYWDEVRTRIIEPHGLALTAPQLGRRHEGLVQGHLPEENPFGLPSRALEEGLLLHDPSIEYTGGGIVSSSSDLAHFARLLWGGRVAETPYVEEFGKTVLIAPDKPEAETMGLGVFIHEDELGTMWEHGGWFPGYRTVMAYFPEHDAALAIQVNGDSKSWHRELHAALRRVLVERLREAR